MSKSISVLASLPLIWAAASCAPPPPDAAPTAATEALKLPVDTVPIGGVLVPIDRPRICPATPAPRTVEIREANPQVDKAHHDQMRQLLADSVQQANTTVLLGPNVLLDFSDAPESIFPLRLGPCVTLQSGSYRSLSGLQPATTDGTLSANLTATAGDPTAATKASSAASKLDAAAASKLDAAKVIQLPLTATPSRTPSALGPTLVFGPHRSANEAFLGVLCGEGETPTSDNVTISGFRLIGPSYGQQEDSDIGIKIMRCLNVEVSNMEIAGWGGQGIRVDDARDPANGPGQTQPSNLPGDRIGRTSDVRIFRNYIHHNQHPRTLLDGHTAGYGVAVYDGAWAQIYENVFDSNRHAIAASGWAGGYDALRNLVLKGGGIHYDGLITVHTHSFNIHGTGDNGFGGQASVRTLYADNSFQYRAGNAIEVRGRPGDRVTIRENTFPHPGLEDDWGDDAVAIDDRDNLDVIDLGPDNTIDYDSYGKYGVCDFDGDGVDDVFLATGRTWWFSSFGEFQWSYLSARHERIDQVKLGYFDDDQKCDVLTESGGNWYVASGGTGAWVSLGAFGAPMSEIAVGRFDPNVRDHRPGKKKTTHAFWRTPSGEWKVTPLSSPNWQHAQSSSYPMSKLRFGDFTGDGVTDVLTNEGGHWSISESATGGWRKLSGYDDAVGSLLIADLANDNTDDLLKLEVATVDAPGGLGSSEIVTWWVSDDGVKPWRKLESYTFPGAAAIGGERLLPLAGRFGAAPGGGVLLVDHARQGLFYSEAEIAAGAAPEWSSLYPY